ncbi:aminoglycoside phosphotransferase APH(3') [Bacillus sp. FJAT-27225]|uniref:phosphotransferase family protein n=1 Tax=Bacillus sp. FJAT-27225 TaxID=1743144 RepID=UPI00080C2772|nr:aminoglycoside phosphotransferase family protein [Bacillus sp. FJAT-27225]OCA85788.1 aminoglycoside phosphotransferase APH(3') [Bacillus sp. FJAT-27225]
MREPIQLNEIPLEIKRYVGTIQSITFPRQGCTSDVVVIKSESGKYALKRTKNKLYSSWLTREVAVLDCLAKQTKLPVPKVLHFTAENDKNEAWALTEFLEGETLRAALSIETNKHKRLELLLNFGKILSEIHSTPCPDELRYDAPWLDYMLAQAEENFKNGQADGTRELLERIQQEKPGPYKQTLIHGDFTIDNVLVCNGGISGVIDWGAGAFGDPRYDVSLALRPKPNAFESKTDREVFFEGYGARIITEKEYGYFADGLYEFF